MYRIVAVILIAASMACSRGNPRPAVAATPTSPTTTGSAESTIVFVGGVSGPMDVLFPGRDQSFQFRNDLETKYRTSLGRAAGTTFVNPEGELVWTQEYIRYRVNGCDHATAVQRVMAQIDGGAPGGICAAPPEGVVLFPSRADSLDFRRQLETKYQQMGRGLSSTAVDLEGAVIWIQEYLRYRANGCDHATAEQKVFSQIDGGPVPDTCQQPCTLAVVPNRLNVFDSPSSDTFEIRPNRAGCSTLNWALTSDAPWLTTQGDFSNSAGYQVVPFNVDRNNGTPRTGRFRVTWSSGSAELVVNQGGSQFTSSLTMTDPFRAGNQSVTECWFRSTNTPCNFTATSNLPGPGAYTYSWRATYSYGTIKETTQVGTSNTFSISDTCGAPASAADGPANDLDVSVTITDSQGNVVNLRSGQGVTPAWRVRLFSC